MSNEIKRLRPVSGSSMSGAGSGPVREVEIVPAVSGMEMDPGAQNSRQDDGDEAGRGRKPEDVVTLSDEARSLQSEALEGEERGDVSESYRKLAHLRPELTEEPEFQDLLDRVLGTEPPDDVR